MSIGLIFLMSLACVCAALLMLIRVLGVRRVLKHATVIDVIFTIVMCLALAGTLTGILIGIVAGLVMTGALSVWRAVLGRWDDHKANRAKPIPAEDWCPGGAPDRL